MAGLPRGRAARSLGLRTPIAALALAAVALVAAPRAAAGAPPDRFALDTFNPAPAGDRFFQVESADVLGHGAFDAALVAELALQPFRQVAPAEDAEKPELPIVSLQAMFHAGLAVTLWDRWKLSADMPYGVTAVNNPVEAPTNNVTGTWAPGDLRLGLRFRIGGDPGDAFRLALSGYTWLPTGDEPSFAGEGKVRGGPRIVMSGRAGRLTWGSSGGFVFRPHVEVAGAALDSQFSLDGGVVIQFSGALQIALESHSAFVIKGEDAPSSRTTNIEMLLGWRYRIADFVFAPAFGIGGMGGAGSPIVRPIVSLSYAPLTRLDLRSYGGGVDHRVAPPPPETDADHDGVQDWDDVCPYAGGTVQGCPDADSDGVPDKDDACPARPGPSEGSGCPVHDADHDGIADVDDACPDLPGVHAEIPRDNGCPGDSDADGVFDGEDSCPNQAGRFSVEPAKNGCPESQRGDEPSRSP